jgi:hypothetical protein
MKDKKMETSPEKSKDGSAGLPDGDGAFKKVIEKSKANLAGAVTQKIGRAGKRGKYKKRGRPKVQAAPESPRIVTDVPTSDTPQTSTVADPGASLSPTPSLAPFIKMPLKVLSEIPAQKHEIPELALTDDEAMACAESLDQILQAFAPNMSQMSPKTAAVISAATVIGSIGFKKWAIFKAKVPTKIVSETLAPEKPPEPQTVAAESQALFSTTAVDHFSRKQ